MTESKNRQESSESTKTVIVIGAGASADFRGKNDEEILAEVRGFDENGKELQKATYLSNSKCQKILKPRSKNQGFNMPTGEELIAEICDEDKLVELLLMAFLSKVVKRRKTSTPLNEEKIGSEFIFHFFLRNKGKFGKELERELNQTAFANIPKTLASVPTEPNNPNDHQYHQNLETWNKERQTKTPRTIEEWLKSHPDFKHYFAFSRLVSHYQPFSIDEFLDSIQNDKIDLMVIDDLRTELNQASAQHNQASASLTQTNSNQENQEATQEPKSPKEKLKEELVNAGKTLIALFLLLSEDKKLFDYNDGICWYRHLRNAIMTCDNNASGIKNKINGNSKEEDQTTPRNLTIISFNYDRSLDFFLRTRLGNFYEDIKVIYPYGNLLLDDDWDDKAKNYKALPYGSLKEKLEDNKANGEAAKGISWDDFEKIKKLGAQIQVIGEVDKGEIGKGAREISEAELNSSVTREYLEKDDEAETDENETKLLTKIQKIICKTKKIYLLGFAFHQQNSDLINLGFVGINYPTETREIFYTNFSNSKTIERTTQKLFSRNEYNLSPSTKGIYDALLHDFAFDFS